MLANREKPLGQQNTPARPVSWNTLTLYERFEQLCVFVLINLMALVVVAALWSLIVRIGHAVLQQASFEPINHVVFQSIFGMMLTVIIALEFKRSILVIAKRQFGLVQVRIIILIGMLAVVRKFIVLDLATTHALMLFALAASVLALGVVYWLVRDQDRKEEAAEA
jgi:uncharacterized membrane protein (DUF373 family)